MSSLDPATTLTALPTPLAIGGVVCVAAIAALIWISRSRGEKFDLSKEPETTSDDEEEASEVGRLDLRRILDESREIFGRPLEKLRAVHIDLPRLCWRVTVDADQEDGTTLNVLTTTSAHAEDDVRRQRRERMRDVISALDTQLNAGKHAEYVSAKFTDYIAVEQDDDAAVFLANFLPPLVPSAGVNVLKAANQSAIAPTVVQVKLTLGSVFRYNSTRGSWQIRVHIRKDSVVVTHTRRERGVTVPLEFTWAIQFTFDRAVTELHDVSVAVTSYHMLEDGAESNIVETMRQVFGADNVRQSSA